jgi:hypothetical protein
VRGSVVRFAQHSVYAPKETHAVAKRHQLVDLVVHNGIAISDAGRSLGVS